MMMRMMMIMITRHPVLKLPRKPQGFVRIFDRCSHMTVSSKTWGRGRFAEATNLQNFPACPAFGASNKKPR
eukprot:8069034-Karenia_brevis.AAC.1